MANCSVCLNCCLVKMSDGPGTFRIYCSRITLHGENMVGSTDLIFSNGRELIVVFDFSSNILLITSLILHVLLNPYMIHTYLSISSKICCSKGILPSELNTLTNWVSFNGNLWVAPSLSHRMRVYSHYLRMSISQSRLLDFPLSG